MNLITPSIGLIFWQLIIFILLLIILKIFAWTPIINFINERENKINNSIKLAKNIKKEYSSLEEYKKNFLKTLQLEREKIIQNSIIQEKNIIEENKKKMFLEAKLILENNKKIIQNEKLETIKYIKSYIIKNSIIIAEHILKKELSLKENQKIIINNILNKIK